MQFLRSKRQIAVLTGVAVVVMLLALLVISQYPEGPSRDVDASRQGEPKTPSDTPSKSVNEEEDSRAADTGGLNQPVREFGTQDERELVVALLDALQKAAAQGDFEAIARIREEIRSHTPEIAQPIIDGRLEDTREEGPADAPRQYSVLIANLMLLAYPGNLDILFVELRGRWTRPGDDNSFDRWEEVNKRPVSVLAHTCLQEVERVEAAGLVDVLVRDLSSRGADKSPLLQYMEQLYAQRLPEGERPDPWLSLVVDLLRGNKRSIGEVAWRQCESWLQGLHDCRGISPRLRRQVSIILVDAPESYWELMDAVGDAESIDEVGEAFRQYLEDYNITKSELEMMISLLVQRFGSSPNQYRELMFGVASLSRDTVPPQRLQGVAGALVDIAQTSTEGLTSALSLRMTYGILQYWRGQKRSGNDLGPILTAADGVGVESLKALYQGLRAPNGRYDDVETGLLLARIIALMFHVDDTLSNKLQAVSEVSGGEQRLEMSEVVAILNGLELCRGEMTVGHGSAVARLLDYCFSKYGFSAYYSDENRPLSPQSTGSIHLRQIGIVLESCGWPALPPKTAVEVRELATAVMVDSSSWTTGGRIGARTIDEVIRKAEALLAAYE